MHLVIKVECLAEALEAGYAYLLMNTIQSLILIRLVIIF